jgi:hypothetical protein
MLNYNEQKVQQGKAELIDAVHFGKETKDLSFRNKQRRFEILQEKNQNVKTNSVHISLNFDTSEKPGKEKLQQIAAAYLDKIGFANQPCLVYQHFDAGHPHIHIVTTNVKEDGKRIDLHNIGRNQSEKARKEIETEFQLIRAESKKQNAKQQLQPVNVLRVNYGKAETKKAIALVLNYVIDTYKYTSVHELNAVLRLYNIVADRGSEDSRVYQKRGLVYRVLDEHGNKIGVPIKASAFYSKPTLDNLERKFELNEVKREKHKSRVRSAIDFAFYHRTLSLPELIKTLRKDEISPVLRQSKEGMLYGITYVDFKTKCVFNGSELGKEYCAKRIHERCSQDREPTPLLKLHSEAAMERILTKSIDRDKTVESNQEHEGKQQVPTILEELMWSNKSENYLPHELIRKKKQKKKRGLHL